MKTIQIGSRNFDVENHTYIMGILNVTPDSFSDGGRYKDLESVIERAERMIKEGVDIIDVGGESTRPGYTQISDEEEIERVAPVVEEIKRNFDIPVSVDTYKPLVAREAILSGADLINDIWGLKYDADMSRIIAKGNVACCLMHNRQYTNYVDFIPDCLSDLSETIRLAENSGINCSKIILDPGIGFAKTYEQNLLVMKHLESFVNLGYPLLLGASRKSVVGQTLKLPVDERMEGTLATSVIGVMKGCAFVRVHDIKENKRAIMMAEAIKNG